MHASAVSNHPLQIRRSRVALRLAGDARLVSLVRAGDEVAFEVIYDRHAPKLLSFCRHMLGSQHDAEDALQRTFASAYRALLGDERSIELRPWLFAIARNECISIVRRRRADVELGVAEPATAGLSATVESREDLRALLADLRELPERQRAALLLSELGGLTHAQVADVVGVRAAQVKALVFQARSNLIAERDARGRNCAEVREELANARGASLLKQHLRRHVRSCRGCREYADAVAAQRKALALVLPVVPGLALRSSALRAALGGAHSGGAPTAGMGVAAANAGGKTLLMKGLAVVAVAGVGAGAGGLAIHGASNHPGVAHSAARGARTSAASSGREALAGAQGAPLVTRGRGARTTLSSAQPGAGARAHAPVQGLTRGAAHVPGEGLSEGAGARAQHGANVPPRGLARGRSDSRAGGPEANAHATHGGHRGIAHGGVKRGHGGGGSKPHTQTGARTPAAHAHHGSESAGAGGVSQGAAPRGEHGGGPATTHGTGSGAAAGSNALIGSEHGKG